MTSLQLFQFGLQLAHLLRQAICPESFITQTIHGFQSLLLDVINQVDLRVQHRDLGIQLPQLNVLLLNLRLDLLLFLHDLLLFLIVAFHLLNVLIQFALKDLF